MTSTDRDTKQPKAPKPESRRSFGTWLREMPRWQKIALGAALTSAVVGGVMTLVQGEPPAAPATGGGNLQGLGASLIEGPNGNRTGAGSTETVEPASKGFFRLGFKLAAIVLGFWLVVTFLLAYAGLVTVEWQQIDALWQRFVGSIESEWGNFQTFMLGSLPATGLAATGLAIGLKRR